jgi:hypothetical protein
MPGMGDLSKDPLFIGGDPFDFHLSANSPCIDAGNPLFDVQRFEGKAIDIGAHEFFQYPDVEISFKGFPTRFSKSAQKWIIWKIFLISHSNKNQTVDIWLEISSPKLPAIPKYQPMKSIMEQNIFIAPSDTLVFEGNLLVPKSAPCWDYQIEHCTGTTTTFTKIDAIEHFLIIDP